MGLADRSRELVRGYSGGMKRRLNIAGALLHDPDIILLDEPTVGVDPQSRTAIFDNLEALKARGKTIVYTTHFMEEADRRGVLINIAAAVFIAGFMGFLFGGSGKSKDIGKIPIVMSVEDQNEVSEAIASCSRRGRCYSYSPIGRHEQNRFRSP